MSSRTNSQAMVTRDDIIQEVNDSDNNDNKNNNNTERRKGKEEEATSMSVGCKRCWIVGVGLGIFVIGYLHSPLWEFGMNPAYDFLILFLVAIVALIILRFVIVSQQSTASDQDDFDAIISQVAKNIYNQEEEEGQAGISTEEGGSRGSLEEPLLSNFATQAQAQSSDSLPATATSRIFHVEERQFGITDKKSGEVFLEGTNSECVQRLQFSKSETGNGASIQGSRSSANGSSNNKNNNNNNNNNNNFVIQKGFVSAVTRKFYWEEACQGYFRRVVTGQFDDDDLQSFTGEWLASNGSRGSLVCIINEGICSVDYAIPLEDTVPT